MALSLRDLRHRRTGFGRGVRIAAVLVGTASAAGLLADAQLTESPVAPGAVVHLKVSVPASPQVIPDTLFGSFLEPIGHSTYGGLWAQVLENPSFEEGLWSANNVEEMLQAHPELHRASQLGLPLPWQPLDATQGNRYLAVRGDAGNSEQSLLVMSLPGKEVGVLQEVYLPARRELAYNGSLMVKDVRGPAAVSLTLRRHGHPEQMLASASVKTEATQWTKYPFTLTLKAGTIAPLEPVDLVVSLANDQRAEIDNVLLNPADAVDGMDPDEVRMARELESPVVRFGGNFTSAYDWHDGVGPQDKRVSKINPSWGIPEYNTFGTDEFLRFCELIHAQPQIALNLGTGTPAQAADWVRYVDDHWGDRKGGLLWELGNELWGHFQIGYPSPERIAAVTLATSRAVRSVDPRARLIATGGDEEFFPGWNVLQLANPPGTFNFLSTHFVVDEWVQMQNSSEEFRTMAALALPWGLAPRMHAIQAQAAAAGHPEVRVAFTEWLMISDLHDGPNFTNLGGALFAGGFLNMLMRNSDVVSISNMTGIMEFGGIWKKHAQVYGAPAYFVLREYSRMHPHLLLEVASDGPTYSVAQGVTRLPEIKDVPYLDCVAAEPADRSKLLLTCVNRELHRDLAAEFDLSGLPLAGTAVQISTLAGDNILLENDEHHPDLVTPQQRRAQLGTVGASGASGAGGANRTLRYSFPSASVTVLAIPLRR